MHLLVVLQHGSRMWRNNLYNRINGAMASIARTTQSKIAIFTKHTRA